MFWESIFMHKVKEMRKTFFILISCFLMFSPLYGQRKETFRAFEDSITHLHREILNERNAMIRYQKNEQLLKLFEDALKLRNSINYPFDSVKTISILTSPDKKVRIITWFLIAENGTHEHYGFLQAYNSEKGKHVTYPLTDSWQKIVNPNTQQLTPDTWFGALYTQIIQTKDDDKTYYTLLGWNGGNVFSQYRVIEVLSLNHDRPVFGANIFRNYTKRTMRVLFQIAPVGRMNLSYEKQTLVQKHEKKKREKKKKNSSKKNELPEMDTLSVQMIIFDRLVPMDEHLQKLAECYVGESSLNDAFIEQNGKWYFRSDVLGRNPDKELPAYERKKPEFYKPVKKQVAPKQ